MTEKIGNLTAQSQIKVMQNLGQSAASWICEMSPRSLRDCYDVPRNEDGTYDGQELAKWRPAVSPVRPKY